MSEDIKRERAAAVHAAIKSLNAHITAATDAGLVVNINVTQQRLIMSESERPVVSAYVYNPL